MTAADTASDPKRAGVEALFRLLERKTWPQLSLRAVAEEAGESETALRRHFRCRQSLLDAFAEHIDIETLIALGAPQATGGSQRDRLFEVLMARIDALEPYRAALLHQKEHLQSILLASGPKLPVYGVLQALRTERSMAKMLRLAGGETGGITGYLRVRGLVVLWGAVLWQWLQDDSPERGRTMNALDKALGCAEELATSLLRDRDGAPSPAAA